MTQNKQEIQPSKYELKVPKAAEGEAPELQPSKYPLKDPSAKAEDKPKRAKRKSSKK